MTDDDYTRMQDYRIRAVTTGDALVAMTARAEMAEEECRRLLSENHELIVRAADADDRADAEFALRKKFMTADSPWKRFAQLQRDRAARAERMVRETKASCTQAQNELSDRLVPELEAQDKRIAELEAELNVVDTLLARRTALDGAKTRADKISLACRIAAEKDPSGRIAQLDNLDADHSAAVMRADLAERRVAGLELVVRDVRDFLIHIKAQALMSKGMGGNIVPASLAHSIDGELPRLSAALAGGGR